MELVIEQDGIETVAYCGEEVAIREWLRRKADSHVAHGWAVRWLGEDSFEALKQQPNGGRQKRRVVFLRPG